MMITSPCYNCEKRFLGCHSSCDMYKDFKVAKEEESATINKKRGEDGEAMDFLIKQSGKRRR